MRRERYRAGPLHVERRGVAVRAERRRHGAASKVDAFFRVGKAIRVLMRGNVAPVRCVSARTVPPTTPAPAHDESSFGVRCISG